MFRFIKANSKRSKKICRIILLIILCFFANFFIASLAKDNDEIKQILAAENLEQEVKVDVYTFRNYQGPPYDFDIFQIYKGEQLVYQSEISFRYWVEEDDSLLRVGDDITDDDIANLLVFNLSGGNFFPLSCYIFSLGEQFRLIKILPDGHFEDINQDDKLDYITYETGFSYWNAAHAYSPAPKIVYEYCDYSYFLAPTLMYQPMPSQKEIDQAISRTKQDMVVCEKKGRKGNCWYEEETCLPSSVWSYMLDLMFAGHPNEAYDFLNQVWPEGKAGKSNFIHDFERQLKERTIWPILEPVFTRINK